MIKNKSGYGYVRVSTISQKEEGLSLENQEEMIKNWAKLHDIELIHIFKDAGISGRKTENRPDFLKLMKVLKKGQYIITYSLTRISRSVIETLHIYNDFEKRKIQLICLKENFDTSTASGKMLFQMMAVVSEFESNVTKERTLATMQYLKDQDRAIGRVPYGWRKASIKKGSGLVEVPEEQAIIQLIIEKREREICKATSWYIITKELNEEDIPPPGKSKKWYENSVRRIAERGSNVRTAGKNGYVFNESDVNNSSNSDSEESNN